ncbi:hypothetical protein GSI_15507 [Ganoderma sinense ZZ0214-1]|uniref:Uncharacterized protein n=1 Tax=Ganoderma sinense ZZ0214-1 TaxID=1077348 RepID=A0A2G8RMS0_9APHY|nr:hypothetical protein GSI_15507 [Ganoderma sinense ZZ0214-1]
MVLPSVRCQTAAGHRSSSMTVLAGSRALVRVTRIPQPSRVPFRLRPNRTSSPPLLWPPLPAPPPHRQLATNCGLIRFRAPRTTQREPRVVASLFTLASRRARSPWQRAAMYHPHAVVVPILASASRLFNVEPPFIIRTYALGAPKGLPTSH